MKTGNASIRDRTQEFLGIAERSKKPFAAQNGPSSSGSKREEPPRSAVALQSEFNRRASRIGFGIYQTSQKLAKLAKLAKRTSNLKVHENRRQLFSSSASKNPTNPFIRQRPLATMSSAGTSSAPPLPWANSRDSPSQMLPKNQADGESQPLLHQQRHQQQQMVPLQDSYMQSRAEALQNVESTIHELSSIFNQLATLVSQQGEIAIRIDENMDDTLSNVEGAQGALLKYLNSISSNRNCLFGHLKMVGGGNRRDEGSFTVSNTNVFAALDSLRKKKKSDKEKGSSKGGKGTSKGSKGASEAEKQVYWAPAPLTSKSWADVDDEDDDDYYATTAPPQVIWGASGSNKPGETQKLHPVEESESEDDLLDEGDDDVEDEHDPEPETEQEHPQPVLKKPVEASPAPKEAERQLSKKERKKKELEELEAILADFGVNPKEKAGDERSDVTKDRKEEQANGNTDKKDNNAPGESKNAKKKKKKDKSSKETKEPQDQPNTSNEPNGPVESPKAQHGDEENTSTFDVKDKLKKMASVKKKKSSKEMDAAARAAAVEAAARSARLAAAKKKEKNHYNQQPIRVVDKLLIR
ncbi:syntaxin [Striga asiatica]|uniref:Syntaxin n=1 Tax=Striga asiatica TaxID=4170 RepID=A0A5A7PHM6_STRAF|nr:syntaxin [Striga asiatica]